LGNYYYSWHISDCFNCFSHQAKPKGRKTIGKQVEQRLSETKG
jgi:hypothetical protein